MANTRIKKFNFEGYYQPSLDEKLQGEDALIVNLAPEGKKLIAEFYKHKYSSDIDLSYGYYAETLRDLEIINTKTTESLSSNILKLQKEQNVRKAFILDALGGHSSLLVYVKEGDKSMWLMLDSLPDDFIGSGFAHKFSFYDESNKIYLLGEKRQVDFYSCHTDALVIAKEILRKNAHGEYALPNLTEFFEKHSTNHTRYYIINKLPAQLLKTSQTRQFRRNFIMDNDAEENKILDYYSKKYIKTIGKDKINIFLKEKGKKYANIIEIQYYINQVQAVMGSNFNDLRESFIRDAKEEFGRQVQTNNDYYKKRLGIYSVANNYVNKFNLENARLVTATSKGHYEVLYKKLLDGIIIVTNPRTNNQRLQNAINIAAFDYLIQTAQLHKPNYNEKDLASIRYHDVQEILKMVNDTDVIDSQLLEKRISKIEVGFLQSNKLKSILLAALQDHKKNNNYYQVHEVKDKSDASIITPPR